MLPPPTLYRSLSKTFVLIAVIPLLLLSIIILYHLIGTYTQEINDKNQLLARAISGQVEAFLSAPLAVLKDLRYQLEQEIDNLSEARLQMLLNQHVEAEAFFDSIYLLSADGRISHVGLKSSRSHQRSDFTRISLSHLGFYRQAMRNKTATWSDTFQSLITSGTSLALCMPLHDERSLIANISIDFLQQVLQQISQVENVEAIIVDRRGEVIAISDSHRKGLSENLRHLNLIRLGLQGQENSGLFVDQGVSHLGSVAIIDGAGWLTLIAQPTRAAYRPVSNAGILFAIGIILAIILAMAFALRKAHRVARPFLELSHQAEAIAKGNYDLPELTPAYEEVALLGENVQRMAAAIQEREAALKLREQDYRTLADNLPAIVYRITLQENNRTVLLNSFQLSMTGFTAAELSEGGTGFFASRIHPEDFSSSREQIQAAIEQREPFSIDYRFLHKDGFYRHFIERGTPVFSAEQQPVFLDGVIFDSTEQQRAREILLQTEKMMSVGGLAAGMAHEINNPLAGILLNLELIRQRLSLEKDANQKRAADNQVRLEQLHAYLTDSRILQMLDAIDDAANRTAKIVENVLSFSRKGTGKLTLKSINELIEQTLKLAEHNFDLKKGFDFKKIKINRVFAADLPRVQCEPSQIQQVLLNLLENAAQAMFESTAELRDPVITIATSRQDNNICLEVSDNGPGMEKSIARRVFEPFFTTKETGKGTGLGLSVSYFIITSNHHGKLSVESLPGVGTTFRILLPETQIENAALT